MIALHLGSRWSLRWEVIGIAALAHPDLVVEIVAVAALPD